MPASQKWKSNWSSNKAPNKDEKEGAANQNFIFESFSKKTQYI